MAPYLALFRPCPHPASASASPISLSLILGLLESERRNQTGPKHKQIVNCASASQGGFDRATFGTTADRHELLQLFNKITQILFKRSLVFEFEKILLQHISKIMRRQRLHRMAHFFYFADFLSIFEEFTMSTPCKANHNHKKGKSWKNTSFVSPFWDFSWQPDSIEQWDHSFWDHNFGEWLNRKFFQSISSRLPNDKWQWKYS